MRGSRRRRGRRRIKKENQKGVWESRGGDGGRTRVKERRKSKK